MRHLIAICLAATLIGCQKMDIPEPSEIEMAKGHRSVLVLSEILLGFKDNPPDTRILKNMFSNKRLLYKGGMDEGYYYTYDEANRMITLKLDYPLEFAKNTVEYFFKPNGLVEKFRDSTTQYKPYPGGFLNITGSYQYHGFMRVGSEIVHYNSINDRGVLSTKYIAISPWITKKIEQYRSYRGNMVTYEQITISFIKQTGLYETTVYNQNMQVVERYRVSPTIKDPEYNIAELPTFERITDKVARDKSRCGFILDGSNKTEGLLIVSYQYFDANGNLTESRIKENIVINSDNLPVSYRENNLSYKLVYTKL
jgi:hypothetical protein